MAFRFFDIVLQRRLREGRKLVEAKADAYDAVELRFGIYKRTLQNYMTRERASSTVNDIELRFDNEVLADYLREVNEELEKMLAENKRLLGILEEANEELH